MKRLLFTLAFMFAVLGTLVSACAQGTPAIQPERQVVVEGKAYHIITVAELKSMLDNKDFLLVNVHIPYAGEIKGTDMFIPYNEIEQNLGRLPDKNAKIVVYCRSGNMSNQAAQALVRLGYTNIQDVSGGMEAWEQAGFTLIPSPK